MNNTMVKSNGLKIVGLAVLLMALLPVPAVLAHSEPFSSIQALATEIKTPRSLEKFMKKNLHYVSDRAQFGKDEYWQRPEEMLKHKGGDCEDYALFAQAMLQQMGYKAFVISLFWEGDAHAVAVFEEDGKWGVFNLANLSYTNVRSLAELAKHIRPVWSYVALMRADGNAGVISQKFQSRMAASTNIATALLNSVKPLHLMGPVPPTGTSSGSN